MVQNITSHYIFSCFLSPPSNDEDLLIEIRNESETQAARELEDDRIVVNADSVTDLLAEMRRAAKRGDTGIHNSF